MKVRLGISGNRIAADIPRAWNTRAENIPGRKPVWDKTVEPNVWKWWSYPLSMATCRALREEFGDALWLSPELEDWAWSERRTEESIELLRAGGEADLKHVADDAPALWAALQTRPFQIAGAQFINTGKRVCLGDEPRLGKTYQSLAAVVEADAKRVLIACPRTATKTVWGRKIEELLGESAYVAQGDRSRRESVIASFNRFQGHKFLVINLEMMRVVRKYQCPDGAENRVRPGKRNGCQADHTHKTVYYPEYPELFAEPWDAIILDESHNALAASKHQISDKIPQIRLGAVRLPIAEDGLKVAMSGTPFRSKLERAWGTLNWLWPERFSSFWKFAEEQFGTTQDKWGGYHIKPNPINAKAYQDMLRPYYLARTKAEVAPQLKPIESVEVFIDMDDSQAKAYRGIEEMGLAKLADGSVITANGVLAELTRMKQFACSQGKLVALPANQGTVFTPSLPSNKLDWVLDFLEERRELSGKVVIVSQFTKLINLFVDQIRKAGWEVVTITGESTDRQREHAQDAFMTGTPRVAVINVFAGGEAIDLSAADEMIFLDEPWTADAIKQAENRIQNLAKRQQLTIFRLRSVETVDEWIAELTDAQRTRLLAGQPEVLEEVRRQLTK